jgi:hypothetical protein
LLYSSSTASSVDLAGSSQNVIVPGQNPDTRYAELVARFELEPDVSPPWADIGHTRGFGANALKVDGRIFAMLAHGRLVVKLPRARVNELVEQGVGERFDPGHGRLMTEWLSLREGREDEWEALAREALSFGRRPR